MSSTSAQSLIELVMSGGDIPAEIDMETLEETYKSLKNSYMPEVERFRGVKKITPGIDQTVAATVHNFRKSYMSRFITTGLTGFLFSVAKEWEAPDEVCTFTHDTSTDPVQKTYSLEEIGKYAENIAMYTTKALELKKYLENVNDQLLIKQDEFDRAEHNLQSDPSSPELIAARDAAKLAYETVKTEATTTDQNLIVTTYILNHNMYTYGKSAHDRLNQLSDVMRKFNGGREVLAKPNFAPPPPPQEYHLSKKNACALVKSFLLKYLRYDPTEHVAPACSRLMKGEEIDKKNMPAPIPPEDKDPLNLSFEIITSSAVEKAKKAGTFSELDAEVWLYMQDHPRFARCCATLLHESWCDEVTDNVKWITAPENRQRWREFLVSELSHQHHEIYENIPPIDTFFRLQYYIAVNYEAIMAVTNNLYLDRPDLDEGINLITPFVGTEEEIKKQFERFCQDNQDLAKGDIINLDVGKGFVVLGDFRHNRNRINFYNKNTTILEERIKEAEQHAHLGKQLMEKRITKGKMEQIKKAGPDASEGLSEYQKIYKDLSSLGAKKVISPEETRFLEQAHGDPDKMTEYKQLMELRRRHDELVAKKRLRGELSQDDIRDMRELAEQIKSAEEALLVPDGAVAINVFAHDTQTGKFIKKTEYIEAETPDETQDRQSARDRMTRAMAENVMQGPAAAAATPH